MNSRELLSVGEVAERSGFAASALRYYEAEGLIHATRSPGGRRMFEVWDRQRFEEYERAEGHSLPTLFEKLAAYGV